MATVTLEKVLEQARSLPFEERQKLIETLTAEAFPPRPSKSLEQLMAEQGTRPLRFEELMPAADTAPDESADEIVNWIYAQRCGDTHRSIGRLPFCSAPQSGSLILSSAEGEH